MQKSDGNACEGGINAFEIGEERKGKELSFVLRDLLNVKRIPKGKMHDIAAGIAMQTVKMDVYMHGMRNLYDLLVAEVVQENRALREKKSESQKVMLFARLFPTTKEKNALHFNHTTSWAATSIYLRDTSCRDVFFEDQYFASSACSSRRKRRVANAGSTILYFDSQLARFTYWTVNTGAELAYSELQAAVFVSYVLLRNTKKWMYILQKKCRKRVQNVLYLLHTQYLLRKKLNLRYDEIGNCSSKNWFVGVLRAWYTQFFVHVKMLSQNDGLNIPSATSWSVCTVVAENLFCKQDSNDANASHYTDILCNEISVKQIPQKELSEARVMRKIVRGLQIVQKAQFLRRLRFTKLDIDLANISIIPYKGEVLLQIPCTVSLQSTPKTTNICPKPKGVKFYVLLSFTPSMLLFRLRQLPRKSFVRHRILFKSSVVERLHDLLFTVRYVARVNG